MTQIFRVTETVGFGRAAESFDHFHATWAGAVKKLSDLVEEFHDDGINWGEGELDEVHRDESRQACMAEVAGIARAEGVSAASIQLNDLQSISITAEELGE